MTVDLILLGIFAVTSTSASLLVWRKIPLLLQVPPKLIDESFVTRPSRVKKYGEPMVVFFRERRYRDLYYALLVWLLHRIRLWLLRLERLAFRLLESLQARGKRLSETEARYWGELKVWKQEVRQNGPVMPKSVLASEPPPKTNGAKKLPTRSAPQT